MKIIQKIAFLMLILLSSSNVYSQYFGYKKPDLRQQKQQALNARQITEHLKKIKTARYARRHPHIGLSLSNGQRALLVFFTLIMLMPAVTATIETISSAEQGTQGTSSVEKPSIIHSVPYKIGQELETFGPCETLSDGSKFCCDIGANYTVTCCLHPNTTGFLSRCISFDPEGIIGDQSELNYNLVPEALVKARIMCAERPYTYHIAHETKALLKQLSPSYLQNINGTSCSIETHELNVAYRYFYPLHKDLLDGSSLSCEPILYDINQTNILPSLTKMIEGLVRKFNLPEMPNIFIYSDDACHPILRQSIGVLIGTATFNGFSKKYQAIFVSFADLQKYSDDELYNSFGHESQHLKQIQIGDSMKSATSIKTMNNMEAQADMATVLSSNSPCVVLDTYFLIDEEAYGYKLVRRLSAMPRFTRVKVAEILLDRGDGYPSNAARKSLILTMYEHYRKVRELLLGEKK